jgi:outer membrane protein assembly factor BamD (BamD/ComL family)
MKNAILLLIAVFVLFACASEQKEWEKAKAGDVAALEQFLTKYANGQYADSAKTMIDTKNWALIEQSKNVDDFNKFKETAKTDAFKAQADAMIQKLSQPSPEEQAVIDMMAKGDVKEMEKWVKDPVNANNPKLADVKAKVDELKAAAKPAPKKGK